MSFLLSLALAALPCPAQEAADDPIDRWTDEFRRGLLEVLRDELGAGSPLPAGAEEAILAAVTEDLLRFHLYWLAGDALEGRLAGHPGERRATEYIAAHFARLGLEPVGDPDAHGRATYLQHFPIGRGEERFTARNVVGLRRGEDPDLAQEVVILGAHHDHAGRHGQPNAGRTGDPLPDDDIWNGANDNASGVTALLAIADALARAGLRPRRSILLITFGAEEWGLLGSRHYVQHPALPLERTVAMMNLDMVGKGTLDAPTRATGVASCGGDLFRRTALWAGERAGLAVALEDAYNLRSDHATFGAARIPIFRWHEADSARVDYHRPTDHADRIDYPYMERLVRAAALTLARLSWTAERIEWNPESQHPTREPPRPQPPARTLGVTVSIRPEGGLRVETVAEHSPASHAGLQPGDVLLRVGSVALTGETRSLRQAIDAAPAGQDVQIEIERGGERRTLTTRFER